MVGTEKIVACTDQCLRSIMLKILERFLCDGVVKHMKAKSPMMLEQCDLVQKLWYLTNLISLLDEVTDRIDRGE